MNSTQNNLSITKSSTKFFVIAWVLGLVFYFIDYATRSSPSLMINDLATNFGISNTELVSLVGTYYYTYSICALIAGICLDKLGARISMFAGCFVLGIGCIIFIVSSHFVGTTGRLLQGAGSAFAFPGCVYLATKGFSKKVLATAIGFTQCVGMLGGAAGQFVLAPLIENGLNYKVFWIVAGILCLIPAIAMLIITPKPTEEESNQKKNISLLETFKIIFKNKQSWLTGIISGLLFAPTTVFAMTWAIPYLKGDLSYTAHDAAITAAMASLGWVLGCPLMGYFSDKIAKRKPVILIGCIGMILMALQMLYLKDIIVPKVSVFMFGVFSGVAMIPYSVIKEVNPDYVKGSATGVQNFITFGVTSLAGPLFAHFQGNKLGIITDKYEHFVTGIWFWIIGIGIALILTFFLKETGNQNAENT